MYSLLLIIIYMAFISLGLPDSLLGAAWPVMHQDLGVAISYAGIITMIIAMGTIISSLVSDWLTRKIGAGLVTAISVMMTAVAMFGFATSNHFIMLCIWAVPYGLGAGAVDAALNNYVALHYASRHMSWLHCFWGVGASVSPYIMGQCLTRGYGWDGGYRLVGVIQAVLTIMLFVSLPLWKKQNNTKDATSTRARALTLKEIFNIKGVKLVLMTFLGYCALESTAGLWASSYLVEYRGLDSQLAAKFASLFFLGITFGRFLGGFIADKMGDKLLIRWGIIIIMIGTILIGIPVGGSSAALMGLVVIGLGCAPVYPAIIHSTPANFGHENSQAIIGIQMASAYVGSTLMPPLFGLIANYIHIGLYPLYLLVFAVFMMTTSERLNKLKVGAL